MIDIKKAKEEFMNYVSKYDMNSGRIMIKVKHILRVVENSRILAEELGLSKEQVELAELIGLFHDFGRFEQVRRFDTFSDKAAGIDHAEYSLKVLYEEGEIKKYLDTDKYDDIIKKAVFYHNKAQIDESVQGEALLFAKIIRDADKLDIYKVINEDKMDDVFWFKEFKGVKMSPGLMDKFLNDKFIRYSDIKTNADIIYVFYGYVYDFNFPNCFRIIKENKYLDNFLKRIEETFDDEEVISNSKKLLEICNAFMEEEIKKLDKK